MNWHNFVVALMSIGSVVLLIGTRWYLGNISRTTGTVLMALSIVMGAVAIGVFTS